MARKKQRVGRVCACAACTCGPQQAAAPPSSRRPWPPLQHLPLPAPHAWPTAAHLAVVERVNEGVLALYRVKVVQVPRQLLRLPPRHRLGVHNVAAHLQWKQTRRAAAATPGRREPPGCRAAVLPGCCWGSQPASPQTQRRRRASTTKQAGRTSTTSLSIISV